MTTIDFAQCATRRCKWSTTIFVTVFLLSSCVFAQTSVPVEPGTIQVETSSPIAETAAKNDSSNSSSNSSSRTLKISGGDLLEIKVFGVPELTDSVRSAGAAMFPSRLSAPFIWTD
jgi:protein involved in polysaccharide export with SLBB domain